MKHAIKCYLAGFILLGSIGLTSCGNDADDNDDHDTTTVVNEDIHASAMARADINATFPDTTLMGSAVFTVDNGKVKMVFDITVPSRAGKSVAVHLHEHGDCGDNGKGSHGHWNPTNKQHGKWGSDNFHSGDIGNVDLDAEGKGHIEMSTDLWTIGGDSTTNILNKAVIIHSGVDDLKTQPSGDAGNRIGCGVIEQKNM